MAQDEKLTGEPSTNNQNTHSNSINTEYHSTLIYSCPGAHLYFISNDGSVSVTRGPDVVRIFNIKAEGSDEVATGNYYLQIDTFVYPLIIHVSPCIRTEYGAIILPNIHRTPDSDENNSVGVIVPKEHEEELIDVLENILGQKIVFYNTEQSEGVSDKISNTIAAGAECVSNLLIQGAQKAEQFMNDNTPHVIDNINQSERPYQIRPCIRNGIKIAKDVTSATASLTGFLATTVGIATVSLGQFLAPHIRNHGSKLLSQANGMSENEALEKVDSVLKVTASAVGGLGTVYGGLEQSARIFGQSLSNNTITIVNHRYGDQAAAFTRDTFETVGNGIDIGTHINLFKPKNLAKRTAKNVIVGAKQKLDNNSVVTPPNKSPNNNSNSNNISLNDINQSQGASNVISNETTNSNLQENANNSSLIDMNSCHSVSDENVSPPISYSSEILEPVIISSISTLNTDPTKNKETALHTPAMSSSLSDYMHVDVDEK